MKNRIIIISILLVIVIISITLLLLKKDIFIVEIPEDDSIVKIIYESPSGDVYEIKDASVVEEFVNSINNKKFKEKRSLEDVLWSNSSVELYNGSNKCVYSLELFGEKSIVVDGIEYENEEGYSRDILAGSGTIIGNIHKDE